MNGNPETTNLLLAIMAAVSVLEALMLVGLGIAAWKAYSRVTTLTDNLESQYVQPTLLKVNALLDDVHGITSVMRSDRDRVERVIRHTVDRVDGTANRLKEDVRARTSWLVGAIRGIRVAVQEFLQTDPTDERDPINHPPSTRTH